MIPFLVRNQFRCGIDSWRHRCLAKEFKTSEFSSAYVVCGRRRPILINTFPTRRQFGSYRQEMKSRFLLKKVTFYRTRPTRFHTCMAPTQFQESIFPPTTPVQKCRLRFLLYYLVRGLASVYCLPSDNTLITIVSSFSSFISWALFPSGSQLISYIDQLTFSPFVT